MMGNGDEGFLFTPEALLASPTVDKYINGLLPALNPEDVESAALIYVQPDGESLAPTAARVYADSAPFFYFGARGSLDAL